MPRRHKDGEEEQIIEAVPLVGQDAGDHHEQAAAQGQGGEHEAAEGRLLPGFPHEAQEDGEVHGVEGDDGDLGGIKAEGAQMILEAAEIEVGPQKAQASSPAAAALEVMPVEGSTWERT